MKRRTIIITVASAGVLAVAAVGTVYATGAMDDENQQPITGDALTKASAVALQTAGGGRVTDTEVNDEESYYQVEVTLSDGTQVDVNLDKNFNVVKTKTDSETGAGDTTGEN